MSTETVALPAPAAPSCGPAVEPRSKSSIVLSSPLAGMLWFAGWLFSVGFLNLTFWKALLGLLVWPYFLGNGIR